MENRIIKSGFVSIIGLPNAGKSTFLNAVIKENIAITSKKPQTTRKNIKGIYNDDNSQIVFIDTPGIHKAKSKLDEFMEASINNSMQDVDVIIVIVDSVTYMSDDYKKIITLIEKSKSKKILLINKIDVFVKINNIDKNDGSIYEKSLKDLKKKILNKFDSNINFDKIIEISALKRKSIGNVISEIKLLLNEGQPFYDNDYITDEPMKQIVADIIRKHCLYKLDKEVPHGLTVVVDSMKESKSKCMYINATIVCERDTHKGIIIGKGGFMIKNIGTGARIEIEKLVDNKVNLKLNVIVKENWKDERTLLANYGYDIKNI